MRYEDSRQAWVVAVSGCLMMFITLGMNRVNGLLFVDLMEKEGLSRGIASWPFSLPGAAVTVISPIAGILSTRYSPTCLSFVGILIFVIGYVPCYFSTNIFVVCVFFGIIRGCGMGLATLVVPILTGASFKRHRATAMGLSTSGQAIGGIILPLLVQLFLFQYGLNWTFLLLGAVSAHALFSCLGFKWYHQKNVKPKTASVTKDEQTPLLKDPEKPSGYGCENNSSTLNTRLDTEKQPSDQQETSHKDSSTPNTTKPNPVSNTSVKNEAGSKKQTMNWRTLRALLTNRSFHIVCANQIINVFLIQTLTQVVIDYLADKGIADTLAVYLITSSSLGEIAGRLCLGWIPDRKILSNENHVALCLLVSAGFMVLIIHSFSFPVLVVATFLLGAGQGSALSMNFVHFADRMTREEMILAVALSRSINGLSSLLRAPVIGAFRDSLGSYDEMFYVFTGAALVLALAWIVEGCIVSRQMKKKDSI